MNQDKYVINTVIGAVTVAFATAALLAYNGFKKDLSDIIHEDAKVVRMECVTNSGLFTAPAVNDNSTIFQQIPCVKEEYSMSLTGKVNLTTDNPAVYKRFKVGDNADVSYRIYDHKTPVFVDAQPKK